MKKNDAPGDDAALGASGCMMLSSRCVTYTTAPKRMMQPFLTGTAERHRFQFASSERAGCYAKLRKEPALLMNTAGETGELHTVDQGPSL